MSKEFSSPIQHSRPLISVLMTAYNREKYIGQAIESVLASTYTAFELIIVDDGSTDNTVNLAKQYALKDSRIKVFVNEQNLGDYPNRNKAASYAVGSYLKYVDADDFIYPWGLEIIVRCMEQFPEAGWGFCILEQNRNQPYPFVVSPEEAYEQEYFGRGLLNKAPLSSIIRKEVFDKVGGFTGRKHLGDFELWHILAKQFPLLLMPQGVTWYRFHDEQQSNDNRTDPIVPFKYVLMSMVFFNNPSDIPMNEENIKITQQKIKRVINRTILKNIIECKFSVAKEMYRMYRRALKAGLNDKTVFK